VLLNKSLVNLPGLIKLLRQIFNLLGYPFSGCLSWDLRTVSGDVLIQGFKPRIVAIIKLQDIDRSGRTAFITFFWILNSGEWVL
jgi:hypothetical protein